MLPAGTLGSAVEGVEGVEGDEDASGDPLRHGPGGGVKMLKSAQIVHSNARCVIDCLVLEISAGGAAIQPADPLRCPQRFTLNIKSGESHRCEVCWKHGNKIGVRFLDA